jgi:hypothetical protein
MVLGTPHGFHFVGTIKIMIVSFMLTDFLFRRAKGWTDNEEQQNDISSYVAV